MKFVPTYAYVIFFSLLISLLYCLRPPKNYTYLKLFPPFLFLTLIAEIYGPYLSAQNISNVPLYNFFTVFEFCFYMILISLIVNSNKVRKIIRASSVFYLIISFSNILFFQGMKGFHTITYSLGCLIIVSYCVYYFFELFRLPKSIKLSKNPAFWICSGLLFFYCCGFPLYAFMNFWSNYKWVIKSFDSIVTILNIFLYSLFTIAFLCSRTLKYTLSSS